MPKNVNKVSYMLIKNTYPQQHREYPVFLKMILFLSASTLFSALKYNFTLLNILTYFCYLVVYIFYIDLCLLIFDRLFWRFCINILTGVKVAIVRVECYVLYGNCAIVDLKYVLFVVCFIGKYIAFRLHENIYFWSEHIWIMMSTLCALRAAKFTFLCMASMQIVR